MADIFLSYASEDRERVRPLVAALEAGWSDESLLQEDDMYGETWPRGKSLLALIDHEVHHRGQLTAMLRQAGLGVGFRPKDIVRRAVRFSIDHGDLTALLYLQGYTRRDFVG